MFPKKFSQLLLAIITLLMISPSGAWAKSDQYQEAQTLVTQCSLVLKDFCSNDDYQWLRNNLKNAKAVMVVPQRLRGGFILGGSGGTGTLISQNSDGSWTGPAFYTMGGVSLGLQAGAEASQVVMLVMSKKGMDSLLTTSFKLGADISVAAGPVGAGAKASTADIIAYSKSKGVFGGLSLDGSVIAVRDALDKAYYKKAVSPSDILIAKSVNNPASISYRETVQKLANSK
ncbi:lipid-binding SYLF domain-containing protein [Desulfotalea psychrophila]|uniref:Ysc84 actin-binding domain-containing protein n=1 Tax=Desulfotalea psychrophila (strain LSv54 / DSM 12343) TaxID=177439 RepID=Q6AJD5_DESPS|nr:lipid-binding SYLF domain-containing protein [Desulfotalea psychrophila]CAG37545.1 hypothetical protein DP2816 [Desulfotalea psychrophila LSv54]